MSADESTVERVFVALADTTRRRLLRCVVESGPISASRLADGFPISRQAVSKHLDVLDAAGLVHAERAGREMHYRAELEPLRAVDRWVDETGAAWDRRLGRLEGLMGAGRRRGT